MPSYGSVHSPLMGKMGKKMDIEEKKTSNTRLINMDHILHGALALSCASISTVRWTFQLLQVTY
jgi:hypothetical protein